MKKRPPEFGPPPERDDVAIDSEGRILPYAPQEVRKIVMRLIDQGEILAVIVEHNDQIAVQVFGPPTQKLIDVLETALEAYRAAMKGH